MPFDYIHDASATIELVQSYGMSATMESAQHFASSLSRINKIATDANLLQDTPSYDFVKAPCLSILNSVVDSVRINQDKFLSLSCIPEANLTTLHSPNYFNQITSLENMALDYLGSSLTALPSVTIFEEKESETDILKKKLENLESRIEKLENEARNIKLTSITEDVANKLEQINSDLAICFRGAMDIFMSGQSEDLVRQVAQSLTSVVAKLPFLLTDKNKFASKKKEEQIKEALVSYLGVENAHYFFQQQQAYYVALSDIRHGNSRVYPRYNENRNLFKALIIQIEAYIYTLVFYDKKN